MTQSKKRRQKTWLSEKRLIYENSKEYNHLISIGYTRDQAIKKLKNKPKGTSVDKLRKRIDLAKSQFGITGVTLKGITKSKDVLDFIKTLEKNDIIEPYRKGQDALVFKHPKIWTK